MWKISYAPYVSVNARSCFAIMSTSSLKLVFWGSQPKIVRALVGLPSRLSTSVGRNHAGFSNAAINLPWKNCWLSSASKACIFFIQTVKKYKKEPVDLKSNRLFFRWWTVFDKMGWSGTYFRFARNKLLNNYRRKWPLLDTRGRDLIGTLIADIVLQLLSYVAQTEQEFSRQRQAEGIVAAKTWGVRFGRKRLLMPEAFEELAEEWCQGRMSTAQARRELGIFRTTFKLRAEEWCIAEGLGKSSVEAAPWTFGIFRLISVWVIPPVSNSAIKGTFQQSRGFFIDGQSPMFLASVSRRASTAWHPRKICCLPPVNGLRNSPSSVVLRPYPHLVGCLMYSAIFSHPFPQYPHSTHDTKILDSDIYTSTLEISHRSSGCSFPSNIP